MHATFPEEVNQTYDIIVLLTKSMQSEQMMQILKEQGAISEDTAILCMMNGLAMTNVYHNLFQNHKFS